jgi:hypothetical protein
MSWFCSLIRQTQLFAADYLQRVSIKNLSFNDDDDDETYSTILSGTG